MYKLSAFAPRSICLISSDQSTAFAGVRLFSAWSLRPPAFGRATSAPTLRPTAFAGVRSPLFPSPPDRLCRRSTSDGVGFGANDRPSASAFGRVALVGFASLRSLGGVLSPLRSDHVRKENCKRRCLSQFFFRQITHTPTNYTIFALQIERRINYE